MGNPAALLEHATPLPSPVSAHTAASAWSVFAFSSVWGTSCLLYGPGAGGTPLSQLGEQGTSWIAAPLPPPWHALNNLEVAFTPGSYSSSPTRVPHHL